jgi:hypothetical protein
MTGFGSAEGAVQGGRLRLEIRTVNHRYFNPALKLPSELAALEGELRERLRQLLERGHVGSRRGGSMRRPRRRAWRWTWNGRGCCSPDSRS